jgi:hypothetical protein
VRMIKDLLDTFIENTLHVWIIRCRSEWYSFYCIVSRDVTFDMPKKFSIQSECKGSGSGF